MNKNVVELTGYVANVKEVSDKLVTFGLAVGVKVGEEDGKPVYKNGFVNCKASKGNVTVTDKERVTITGWVSFDFYTPKDSDKERASMVVFVKELTPYAD